MKQEHVSTVWKEAEVLMVNKSGKDVRFLQNYRLISLLPSIRQRFSCSRRKELFPVEQFGFKSKLRKDLHKIRQQEWYYSSCSVRSIRSGIMASSIK